MLNYHKNELINNTLDKYYETFSHTLDTADYVPEKFNKKIHKYIFKNMKKAFKSVNKDDKKYQKGLKRQEKRERRKASRERLKALLCRFKDKIICFLKSPYLVFKRFVKLIHKCVVSAGRLSRKKRKDK